MMTFTHNEQLWCIERYPKEGGKTSHELGELRGGPATVKRSFNLEMMRVTFAHNQRRATCRARLTADGAHLPRRGEERRGERETVRSRSPHPSSVKLSWSCTLTQRSHGHAWISMSTRGFGQPEWDVYGGIVHNRVEGHKPRCRVKNGMHESVWQVRSAEENTL